MASGVCGTRWLSQVDKIAHWIEVISGAFCVIFFAAMFIVMIVGVISRYIMRSPFEWTEELVRFLWLAFGFLAINIGVRRNKHIGVTILVELFPPRVVRMLDTLVDLLAAFFFIVLIRQAYFMTMNTIMTAASLPISMFWPYLTLLSGASCAMIQLVLRWIIKIARRPGQETVDL